MNKWIALALSLVITTGWLVDRHYQYKAGKDWCQAQVAEQIVKEIPQAIKRAETTTKTINQLSADKKRVVDETRDEAIKQNRPTECDLSDGELLKFNELLQEGN